MPHPIDVTVGARVREFRIRAGMSQTELANAIGVSFQQIQKYEKGSNRMGASRLVQVARALNVEPSTLLEGFSTTRTAPAVSPLDSDAAKVARDWARIESEDTRAAMRAVLRQLANGTGDGAVPVRPAA